MTKSVLFLLAISLGIFSCNNSKMDTVNPKAIADSPLTTVSVTGGAQPNQDCKELRAQYVVLDSTLKEYQLMFDAAIIRLDSLVGYNNELEKKLGERNTEIGKLKQQVRTLTEKKKQ
jgi:hypothetical protein